MDHPTLGLLEPKGTDGDSFEGEILSDENKVGLSIQLDDAPQDQVFKLAESVVASVLVLNEKAKNIICRDLLKI